ncbi:hypothetical protein LCGC14_1772410 [marine sediment metagenome]|uniref:SGNH hydrolase-type esterase domain-containing protein n=1 Tax=marine sediment metagenome TaxID=412755 RepID=A0A0F9GXV5_9ZZZZ
MYRTVVMTAAIALAALTATGQEASFEPISKGGGIEVYAKMDFDSGANPFTNQGKGVAALESRAEFVVSGRSLHVKRAEATGYFGARTTKIAVKGTRGLNIAFCVRTKGMQTISLNLYDALKRDNTTPTSPARTPDEQWRTVVFAVEDFHHNSDQPQIKVPANTKHTNLFFHGSESKGASGEYWIDKFIIYRGVDTAPPAAPSGVKANAGTHGLVELTWTEPKDNAFAAVYSIHCKGADGKWVKLDESIQPRYSYTVAAAGKVAYRITAADYDNNVSKPSADVTVTASSPGKIAREAATDQVKDRLAYADNVRKIHAAGAGKVRHDIFLFAGDSITAADSYTHVLGRWLTRGIPVRKGVGQMRTNYGKAKIGEYLSGAKPEFAIVMYGTNDSKGPEAVKAGMANLAAVIDSCAAFGTVPIIATIPPRHFDKDKQDGQVRFNQAIVKLCRAKKVPVSYCFEEMMQRDLKQMLGDGVHLKSSTGNDAAGEALDKTLRQIYFALRDTTRSWK